METKAGIIISLYCTVHCNCYAISFFLFQRSQGFFPPPCRLAQIFLVTKFSKAVNLLDCLAPLSKLMFHTDFHVLQVHCAGTILRINVIRLESGTGYAGKLSLGIPGQLSFRYFYITVGKYIVLVLWLPLSTVVGLKL